MVFKYTLISSSRSINVVHFHCITWWLKSAWYSNYDHRVNWSNAFSSHFKILVCWFKCMYFLVLSCAYNIFPKWINSSDAQLIGNKWCCCNRSNHLIITIDVMPFIMWGGYFNNLVSNTCLSVAFLLHILRPMIFHDFPCSWFSMFTHYSKVRFEGFKTPTKAFSIHVNWMMWHDHTKNERRKSDVRKKGKTRN